MVQKLVTNQFNNKLEKELLNFFHSSGLPLHPNKTGNKEFTNYQRVSLMILFHRSKKSLRDFIEELYESKWVSWLGLKKIPGKSTLHDWLMTFNMRMLRKLSKVLLPRKINLTAIDGTGFDSWQRSRHYEKRVGEVSVPHMPYAKADIFIDVDSQIILDFSLITHREHDVKVAEKIFKRNNIENIFGLGDKGYDSEKLHIIARINGITFYAPPRKKNKNSDKKNPTGKHRRECTELPEFFGKRSLVEMVISVLKRKQINSLRSKKSFMKQREFGWHVILYNINRKMKISESTEIQTFIFFKIKIYSIRTEPKFS